MSVPWYLMAKGKGGGGYKTASGPIVSISDALAAPLRALTLSIDPVQELHGYDSPWPAGGGKNKFDVDKMVNTSDITISNGVITVTGNSKNSTKKLRELADLTVGEAYILTANTTGSENLIYLYGTGANVSWSFGTSKTITQEMLDALVFFYGGSGTTSQISDMMIRLSSVSDASFAPYSNLCPISGWTEANLWRTGKNLFDKSKARLYNNMARFVKYGVNAYADTTPNGECFLGAGTYALTISGEDTVAPQSMGIKDASGNFVQRVYNAKSLSATIPTAGAYIIEITFADVVTWADYDIQLESGEATPYAPYTGNQYTIQLGQTVYGGTLDVTNGVLTVDRAEVDLGTLDWSAWGTVEGLYGANISGMKAPTTADERKTEIICSMYPVASTATMNNNFTDKSCARYQQNVFIRDTGYATADALAAALDGVQFVYPLATPLTYTLTPQQLDTLKGQNVVWADCGDVTVEYLSAGGANADLMKLAVAFMGRK